MMPGSSDLADEQAAVLESAVIAALGDSSQAQLWLESHRQRWQAKKRYPRRGVEETERFWRHVRKTDSCWVWIGSRTEYNRGHFWFRGKLHRAHRVAYMLEIGPIPEGLELDHLCENPPCVNPAHLEPVTRSENILRWYARQRGERDSDQKEIRTREAAMWLIEGDLISRQV